MPQFEDFRGRKVNIPHPLERIISLNPSITETLFLLGMGYSVKGVSAFCRRPSEAEKVKKIGSYSTFNKNVVDEIDPQLILTVSGYQQNLADSIQDEYPLFQIELPSTPFGILDRVNRIGIITGKIKEAQQLMSKMAGELQPAKINLRGYLEIDLGGPVTFGSESYITSTLNYMGISTPYDDYPNEWLTPDYTLISEFNPQLIIMEGKMFRGTTREEVMKRLETTTLGKTEAFLKGKILTTPGKLDFFAHHGPDFFLTVIPWLKGSLDIPRIKNI